MKKVMAALLLLLMIIVEVRLGGILHTCLWMRCVALGLVLLVGYARNRRRAGLPGKTFLHHAPHQRPALT
ncbi:MAG TPA: hypothetical protein VGC22_01010 [Chitinophaga sp.]